MLVGAPASGKTLVLNALADSVDTVFQSNVHPEALVSQAGKGTVKTDPSLFLRYIGRCAVFKDWTELLKSPEVIMQKVYSLFRGMYDGRMDKSFGHGVDRDYRGTFSMLAGSTDLVYAKTCTTSGERFLKFHLRDLSIAEQEAIAIEAMMSVTLELEKGVRVAKAVQDFLNQDWIPPKPGLVLGMATLKRLAALATIISVLRAQVEWDYAPGSGEVLSYRPAAEAPTRLAKQLCKIADITCSN